MKAMDRAAEARLMAYEAEAEFGRYLAKVIAARYRRIAARISQILGHSSTASRSPSL